MSPWVVSQCGQSPTHGPTLVRFSPFSRLLRDCIYAISERMHVLRESGTKFKKVEQIVSHKKYIYGLNIKPHTEITQEFPGQDMSLLPNKYA